MHFISFLDIEEREGEIELEYWNKCRKMQRKHVKQERRERKTKPTLPWTQSRIMYAYIVHFMLLFTV